MTGRPKLVTLRGILKIASSTNCPAKEPGTSGLVSSDSAFERSVPRSLMCELLKYEESFTIAESSWYTSKTCEFNSPYEPSKAKYKTIESITKLSNEPLFSGLKS